MSSNVSERRVRCLTNSKVSAHGRVHLVRAACVLQPVLGALCLVCLLQCTQPLNLCPQSHHFCIFLLCCILCQVCQQSSCPLFLFFFLFPLCFRCPQCIRLKVVATCTSILCITTLLWHIGHASHTARCVREDLVVLTAHFPQCLSLLFSLTLLLLFTLNSGFLLCLAATVHRCHRVCHSLPCCRLCSCTSSCIPTTAHDHRRQIRLRKVVPEHHTPSRKRAGRTPCLARHLCPAQRRHHTLCHHSYPLSPCWS